MANSYREIPTNLIETTGVEKKTKRGFIQSWNALTALPEAPAGASFMRREAARKSRLTSNVLFFFFLMVLSLIPACYLVITAYPSYLWLTLGLAFSCVIALVLNRQGFIFAAGLLVTMVGFLALTAALFSTIPFDETTLQGYDMYIVVELLAVSLLPTWSVFFIAGLSTASILITLLTMPHTLTLTEDLNTRFMIIAARPIGTLFLGAGVAFILAQHLTTAIRRAGRAEAIARLEHEMVEQSNALQNGIQQILETHVAVAKGNYQARAPLAEDNVLWQIARALNTLLVRYQRAAQAEQRLSRIDQVVAEYVAIIQQARQARQKPLLPFEKTNLDPLIAEMQGVTFGQTRSSITPEAPSSLYSTIPRREQRFPS